MRKDPRNACKNESERLLWALVHDGIAHPLMALTGFSNWSVRFHDWTSVRAWPRKSLQMRYGKGRIMITTNKFTLERVEQTWRYLGTPFVVTSVPLGNGQTQYKIEELDHV